jgi:hypothetical protein
MFSLAHPHENIPTRFRIPFRVLVFRIMGNHSLPCGLPAAAGSLRVRALGVI